MAHEADIAKREQFKAMEEHLKPYFAKYDGKRTKFVRTVADASGVPLERVESELRELLDGWHKTPLDMELFVRLGPWTIAEFAVFGPIGHYREN